MHRRDGRHHLVQHAIDSRTIRRLEAAALSAALARREGPFRSYLARQQSLVERRVDQRPHLAARGLRQQLALGLAREQAVLQLVARERHGAEDGTRFVDAARVEVRDADLGDLAGSSQLDQGAQALRQRRVRIARVDLSQVDALDAEAPQAALDASADRHGTAVAHDGHIAAIGCPLVLHPREPRIAWFQARIPRQPDLGQHLGHKLFGATKAVHRRSVDRVHASVDRHLQREDRFCFVLGAPVASTQRIRAEARHRHLQRAAAQPPSPHRGQVSTVRSLESRPSGVRHAMC